MITFISKILNKSKGKPERGDDFSYFFLEAKSREKAHVIKQIMKEATEEQENVIKRYNESKLVGIN